MFEKYIVAAAFFDHIAERAHATIVLGFGLQAIYQDKVMLLQWWDVIGFHWHEGPSHEHQEHAASGRRAAAPAATRSEW